MNSSSSLRKASGINWLDYTGKFISLYGVHEEKDVNLVSLEMFLYF